MYLFYSVTVKTILQNITNAFFFSFFLSKNHSLHTNITQHNCFQQW